MCQKNYNLFFGGDILNMTKKQKDSLNIFLHDSIMQNIYLSHKNFSFKKN
jgi:hypothetical protein